MGDISRGCTVRSLRGGEVGWVIYLGGVQFEVSGEGKVGDVSRGCTVRSLGEGEVG